MRFFCMPPEECPAEIRGYSVRLHFLQAPDGICSPFSAGDYRNWQGRIRAFFPGKKAAKKPAGDAVWAQKQAICACNLKGARRASGQKKNRRSAGKTNSFVFRPVRRFFPVRFAHSRASFAGLPGSGGQRFCLVLLLLLLRR